MTNTDKLYISLGLIKQAQSLPAPAQPAPAQPAPINYPQRPPLGPAISMVDFEKQHGYLPGGVPTPSTPKAIPVARPAPSPIPAVATAGNTPSSAASPSSIPSYLAPMLSAVRNAESNVAGYNTMVGSKENHNLINKTIGDLVAYQNTYKQNNPKLTAAAGAYQLIPGTLNEVITRMKLDPKKDVYNQNLQDRIAHNLMQHRGVDAYLKGKMPLEKIRINLAKEWAGLPVAGGKSYYDKDGKNRANISEKEYLNALQRMKELYNSSVSR
jgi:muramidase (phage lysozyme)